MTSSNSDCCKQLTLLKGCVASDHHTRSDYTGRIQQTEKVTVFDKDGQPFEAEVTFFINWDSISQVLGLVRNRAKLNQ